jgi:hypothetical protein
VKIKTIFSAATLCAVALATTGCATSQKIQVVQIGDQNLSCAELTAELKKLDQAQTEVESKKGLTGTNVAAALFWRLGLAYTYYDAGEANRLISDRRNALTTRFNDKSCRL